MEQLSNKVNILNIACRQFAIKGYDSVSVQEIADLAGITKPTLYYYFGSKSGLLQTLIKEKGGLLCKQLKNACEYNHDFFGSIIKIFKAEIDFAMSEPDYFRLHMALINSPPESEGSLAYKEIVLDIHNELEKFFQLSTNEYGNMKGKEKFYSILFRYNLISVGITVLSGFLKNDEETLKNLAHSFIYGVAN
ncbi:MAG: TetR/AcrR family transcriptional regulator [Treponema sp.]|nr:TetR/AcrR family transcriptional regulator [Treponema sp.]